MPRGERAETICHYGGGGLGADCDVAEAEDRGVQGAFEGKATRNEVGAGLAAEVFETAGNYEGGTFGEKEAEDAAVEFPEAIFEAVDAGPAGAASFTVVGEEAVEDEGVDCYDEHGHQDGYDAGEGDGYSFFFGVGVLDSVVFEGEGLVEGGNDAVDCCIDDSENAGGGGGGGGGDD